MLLGGDGRPPISAHPEAPPVAAAPRGLRAFLTRPALRRRLGWDAGSPGGGRPALAEGDGAAPPCPLLHHARGTCPRTFRLWLPDSGSSGAAGITGAAACARLCFPRAAEGRAPRSPGLGGPRKTELRRGEEAKAQLRRKMREVENTPLSPPPPQTAHGLEKGLRPCSGSAGQRGAESSLWRSEGPAEAGGGRFGGTPPPASPCRGLLSPSREPTGRLW